MPKQTLEEVIWIEKCRMNQAVVCPDGRNIIRTMTLFLEEKVMLNLEIALKKSKT